MFGSFDECKSSAFTRAWLLHTLPFGAKIVHETLLQHLVHLLLLHKTAFLCKSSRYKFKVKEKASPLSKMKQICKRANVPFSDLSARNSTPVCSSKCRQTMENKVTFILVQPFCPSASSNGLRHPYPSPLLFHLCGRSAFSKWRRKKRFLPPLDKKNARRIASSRTLKRKRNTTFTFPAMVENVNVV